MKQGGKDALARQVERETEKETELENEKEGGTV